MRRSHEQEQEYERMRGEYLSLVASLEYNLTFLLAEYLNVQSHAEEFHFWFTQVPIPFGAKVNLFEALTRDSTVSSQFGDVGSDLRDSYTFRNTLAHSFRWTNRTMTARGRQIPDEHVAFPVLKERLERLRQLENLFVNLLANEIEGPLPPISADDFADWPR